MKAHNIRMLAVYLIIRLSTVPAEELLNIAAGKPVMMSSTLYFSGLWEGRRMVDGNINTNAHSCRCCASTDNEDNPWITIDLLQEYSVVKIHVKGIADQDQPNTRLGGVQIYAGNNTSDILISNTSIGNDKYRDPTDQISLNVNVSTRLITLKRPRQPTSTGVWLIVICEIEIFAIFKLRNVALGKPSSISSTLQPYYNQSNPSSAVDGNISKDINMCRCCVSTDNEQYPWLTVDLQGQYLIQKVVVTGRIDNSTRDVSRNLENIQMFNGDRSSTVALSSQNIEIVNKSIATVRNLDAKLIRRVTLKRPAPYNRHTSEWYLTVCEIEIFVIDCPTGNYGRYGVCNQTCGHCMDGRPCDGVTGRCPGGCDPGYTGNMCTQECVSGKYGNNCSENCGHCLHAKCDHVTGLCLEGCQPEYRGDGCHEACKDGYYGNCSQSCGNCFGSILCDHVTGSCPEGCKEGYKGVTCHDECESGKYGNNCSENCGHCLHAKCDHVTGHCLEGCKPGYRGYGCHEARSKCEETKSVRYDITAGVIGAVVGAVMSMCIAISVVLVRRKRLCKKDHTYEEPQLPAQESVYFTLDNACHQSNTDTTDRRHYVNVTADLS